MQKPLVLLALLTLAGCTSTYIAPGPVLAPTLGQPVTTMTTERLVPVSFNDAWNNIETYSQDRYRTLKLSKANGEMTLFVDAFDPDSSITCGMLQSQNGSFDTHREFLGAIAQQVPVNLNMTVQVKLTARSAKQTLVSVNTDYDLAVNYQTNPGTGAIMGGQRYRFDSKGFAMVTAPGSEFAGRCQPTGAVEVGILDAAAGSQGN